MADRVAISDVELRSLERLCSKDGLSDSNIATLVQLGLRAAAEIRLLRARLEQLEASKARSTPVVAAACDVALALHAGDEHCAAGDHDNCTTWREAKRAFDEAVAAYLEPEARCG